MVVDTIIFGVITLLPIIGIVVTVSLSISFSGRKRWLVLFIIPLATLGIPYLFLSYKITVFGLAGLLPAIMLSFYFFGMLIYYPILIIWAIVVWRRNKKSVAPFNPDTAVPHPPNQ